MLDTRKSSKSIMFVPEPSGVKPDKTLKPRIQGIERSITAIILISTAFFLEQPHKSIAKEIIFSNTAITVDNAAKDKRGRTVSPICGRRHLVEYVWQGNKY